MRAKVNATTSWLGNGDEVLEKYPFLKDERFKMERVPTGCKRKFFDAKKETWRFRDECEIYVIIDKLEDFQYLVEMVKKTNGDNANDGQTILMVDDDGSWELEIYDGWRE